jgi:hypothetical protein
MPARQKPVINLKPARLYKLFSVHNKPKLARDPRRAQTKKTREGGNLSAITKIAKSSVPEINPNCTDEVSKLSAVVFSWKFRIKSPITALLANHKEVHKNCAITIVGKMRLAVFNGFE